jgi:hypothetical protein
MPKLLGRVEWNPNTFGAGDRNCTSYLRPIETLYIAKEIFSILINIDVRFNLILRKIVQVILICSWRGLTSFTIATNCVPPRPRRKEGPKISLVGTLTKKIREAHH